jgi:hypothetical protein
VRRKTRDEPKFSLFPEGSEVLYSSEGTQIKASSYPWQRKYQYSGRISQCLKATDSYSSVSLTVLALENTLHEVFEHLGLFSYFFFFGGVRLIRFYFSLHSFLNSFNFWLITH